MCNLSHHYVSGSQVKGLLNPANYSELLSKDVVLVVCCDSDTEDIQDDVADVFDWHNQQESVTFIYAIFADGFMITNNYQSRVCLQIPGAI